jgi:alkanesulfonate monooxygenase SsuD/methylene tetrahydromethanopterin reductase-like flavin-dependent oxidoreductase (luciferase family)
MLGSNGARMLSLALPHVAAWNTWFTSYGNTVDGFATLNAKIDTAARDAGRDPREIARSACVLVTVGDGTGQRPHDVPAVAAKELPSHVRELERRGADEAILVLDPIDERSVREVGRILASR